MKKIKFTFVLLLITLFSQINVNAKTFFSPTNIMSAIIAGNDTIADPGDDPTGTPSNDTIPTIDPGSDPTLPTNDTVPIIDPGDDPTLPTSDTIPTIDPGPDPTLPANDTIKIADPGEDPIGPNNPNINPGSDLVPAHTVTGSGSYCAGSTGLVVGLDGSESWVEYTLYKNGIAQSPTITGTGSAISFGYQTAGIYTIKGIFLDQVFMNGNATITENPSVETSVSISPNTADINYPDSITLTAIPIGGGTSPTFQWYKGNVAVGTNSATYSYVPENGDVVKVVMISNAFCTSTTLATSNSITLAVNYMFPITLAAPTNGTVKMESGSTQIKSGDLIHYGNVLNITTTPHKGYSEGAITANGHTISYHSITISRATVIDANFDPIPYTVSFHTPTHGGLSLKNGCTKIKDGDHIPYGTSLNVCVTPDAGYMVRTLKHNNRDVINNTIIVDTVNVIAATYILETYTWTGATNSDWNTDSNWDSNTVPTTTNDVAIPNVTNKPIVSSSAACKNLRINNNAVLTISSGSLLNVAGIITNNAGSAGLILKSSATSPNGSLIFQNSADAPVSATVEMYSKASWDFTATVGSKFNWQFFGIPLRTTIAEPTLIGAVVRRSEEAGTTSSSIWTMLTGSSTLTSFTGYEIVQAAPTTYSFTGQLENGNLSKNLTYTTGALYPGQCLIGNPYTAAIDITKLSFGSQTEGSVYLFNTGSLNNWTSAGNSSGSNPGQYTVITQNTAGIGQIPGQIPSMQAFVVKAVSNSTNATLSIPYSAVAIANTDKQRAPAMSTKVYTTIDVKGSRFADKMWIFTDPTCSHSFDNGWDGRKLLGSPLTPQLCAMETDGDYQIDAVSDINNTTLGFMAGEDKTYTLTFAHENMVANYSTLYLLDLLENKTVDITATGSEYTFTAEQTSAPEKRFKIVSTPAISTATANTTDDKFKVFSFNKTIVVINSNNSNGKLMVYDIAGRTVFSGKFNSGTITNLPTTLNPGTYLTKAIMDNKTIATDNILIK